MCGAPTRGRGGYRPLNTTGPTHARQESELEEDMRPGAWMEQEHGVVRHQRPSAEMEERRYAQNHASLVEMLHLI